MIQHRQPFRCPLPDRLPDSLPASSFGRYAAPRTAIAEADWPMLIARAEHEGVRSIAHDFGVSHEAVRAALRAAGRVDLLGDNGRRRRLAAAAPPPPPPLRKIPLERHTQAEVAAQRQPRHDLAHHAWPATLGG